MLAEPEGTLRLADPFGRSLLDLFIGCSIARVLFVLLLLPCPDPKQRRLPLLPLVRGSARVKFKSPRTAILTPPSRRTPRASVMFAREILGRWSILPFTLKLSQLLILLGLDASESLLSFLCWCKLR